MSVKKNALPKYAQNPCSIPDDIEENFSRLKSIYRIDPAFDSIGKSDFNTKIFENSTKIVETVRKAKELVNDPKVELRYSLVPRMSSVSTFSGSRIGGMPDFRNCLGFKKGNLKKGNLKKSLNVLWPRCGCCHKRMKFIGQFDLQGWLIPIHALTGYHTSLYGDRKDEYSLFSSLGNVRFFQHASLFKSRIFHVFACWRSTEVHYYNNPGCDSHIHFSSAYCNDIHEEPHLPDDFDFPYPNKIPKPFYDNGQIEGIDGYDFKIEVDCPYSYSDKRRDELELIVDKNPDVFDSGSTDFKLFGFPRSQQEAKRYRVTNRFSPQIEMTPFVSFNLEERDFTIQIYSDLQSSDGYSVFSKIDGSCT